MVSIPELLVINSTAVRIFPDKTVEEEISEGSTEDQKAVI